ncbi:SdpA family antimicrobial peptide system protein [Isoptericola halotolerans]|uniref:SdpA family antimicrobial peptide system protein n=1 Tax=Isoptericola halotolerans TaxID=300560 RepID=UPI00388EFC1D
MSVAPAFVAGAALALVLLFLGTTIFFSLPSNVLAVREGEPVRRLAVALAPQSWGFFTKDPAEEELEPYLVTDEGLEHVLAFPQASPGNPFGISRKHRAQGVELGLLASQVENWFECTTSTGSECRESVLADPAVTITNASPVATVCGAAVLVKSVAVPWAYRDSYDATRYDVEAAVVEVECVS